MKRVALTLAILLIPSAVLAQSKTYKEQVYLDTFDKASNTYSGRIIVTYKLCNDARYGALIAFNKASVILVFDRAQNSDDAKVQKQADVDKIIDKAAKEADLCPVD